MSNKITHKKYQELINRVNHLKIKVLTQIRERIIEARKNGDYSENADLQEELKTKDKVEREIGKIMNTIRNAEKVHEYEIQSEICGKVVLGSYVTYAELSNKENKKTVQIISSDEINIDSMKNKKVSNKSPLFESIKGKGINETFQINKNKYIILDVK